MTRNRRRFARAACARPSSRRQWKDKYQDARTFSGASDEFIAQHKAKEHELTVEVCRRGNARGVWVGAAAAMGRSLCFAFCSGPPRQRELALRACQPTTFRRRGKGGLGCLAAAGGAGGAVQ